MFPNSLFSLTNIFIFSYQFFSCCFGHSPFSGYCFLCLSFTYFLQFYIFITCFSIPFPHLPYFIYVIIHFFLLLIVPCISFFHPHFYLSFLCFASIHVLFLSLPSPSVPHRRQHSIFSSWLLLPCISFFIILSLVFSYSTVFHAVLFPPLLYFIYTLILLFFLVSIYSFCIVVFCVFVPLSLFYCSFYIHFFFFLYFFPFRYYGLF